MSAALQINRKEKFTYEDYLTWPDDERWELIDGVPYNMSPAPRWQHQDIQGKLYNKFYNHLKKKPCKVFNAPFDVKLPALIKTGKKRNTVVQPDILVLCDKSKLDKTGCIGAPDLIIEILSESTALKDTTTKKKLYEKNGVKEYWIVDTWTKSIIVYLLENGKYGDGEFYEDDMEIKVKSFEGLTVNLTEIFNEDW